MFLLRQIMDDLEDANLTPVEPETEVDPDEDHEVGEVNLDLQKLYCLARQEERRHLEELIRVRFESQDREHYVKEAKKHAKKAELLMQAFWVSIRDAFDLWDKPCIGIRRGWKVVWSDEENSSIGNTLSTLLMSSGLFVHSGGAQEAEPSSAGCE